MQVITAESAGFCFGVKRAVDAVIEMAENTTEQLFTYGPIIHNSHVIADLEKKGVKVIRTREELDALKEGTVIIRSHGVAKEVIDSLHRPGIKVKDLTCPFVSRIHAIVSRASEEGDTVLIAGDPDHPEVQGIVGWAGEDCFAVRNKAEMEAFAERYKGAEGQISGRETQKKVTMVAQTTFNHEVFEEFVEILRKTVYYVNVVDTVCNATRERQKEARSIAQQVDAMIVIGDSHSSNSQKLYEICKKECGSTYFIETLADLEPRNIQSLCRVGITAGASTPKNIIEEVQNHVRKGE